MEGMIVKLKIDINSTLYPTSLKNISNPPPALYINGNEKLLNTKCVAIIGSRNASENGKKLANKFASELSEAGVTIVSGLAIGIDTQAHTFSYKNKGKTIAVLGCGFNKLYPSENLELYHKILENDGLIISEYPPDEDAISDHFRKRNRIISGLSSGVLVIEAAYLSGTGITANYAKKQNKKIFALPHEIWDSHGIGTNRLLKNGAILVTCTNDIIKELKFDDILLNYPYKSKKSITSSHIENHRFISFSDKKQEQIYSLLSSSPISLNDLVHKTSYSINEISTILFMLEMEGHIKKIEGGYICI